MRQPGWEAQVLEAEIAAILKHLRSSSDANMQEIGFLQQKLESIAKQYKTDLINKEQLKRLKAQNAALRQI